MFKPADTRVLLTAETAAAEMIASCWARGTLLFPPEAAAIADWLGYVIVMIKKN